MMRAIVAALLSALLVTGAAAQRVPGYPPANSFYVGNGATRNPSWYAPAAARTAIGLATWAVPTGVVPTLNGGTGTAITLTAGTQGGIVYASASSPSTLVVMNGTGTPGQCLLSGNFNTPTWGACAGGGASVSSVSNVNGTLTVTPTTGAVVASLNTAHANTWTAAQSFANSDLILLGSSTGGTTFSSANASAANFTITVPAATDTLAVLGTAQTFSAAKTFSSTVNFTGAFQVGGNVISWPGVATTVAALNLANQVVTGGANVVSFSLGTVSSGTTTINCGNGQQQFLTNNGAFTLAAPITDGACNVQITNGASAGAVTFSNFTVNAAYTGAALTTTSGNKFVVSINRANGSSIYFVVPQQ
jgi:hypothetical protein